VTEPAVRVVLDASAIIAFTRGSVDVGEVIAEVADEQDSVFGLPVLCLAEAARVVVDQDRLEILVNHPIAEVLAPYPDDWRALSITLDTVGRMDAATAVLAAFDHVCSVLTAQPGLYGGIAGGGPVISI
jgi:predicted nucleic acid-binding protein